MLRHLGCKAGERKRRLFACACCGRAWHLLADPRVRMGIGQLFDTTDFHIEVIDLLNNRVPCEAGIALVVAIYSAVKKHSVLPGLLILGDLSIQGNIKPLRSLAEPLQVGMDNGARSALIPLENKRNFFEVSGDIVERVEPVLFSDPMTPAMKGLGMT
jgi:ATP-dependent Lon protease